VNKKVLAIVVLISAIIMGSYFIWQNNEKNVNASSENIEVTHGLGTVHVGQNIQKIVVFDYGTLDTIDQLGIAIAGVPKASLPQYLHKYKGSAYKDVGTLFEPNYEVLAEMQPDIIFISGRQKDLYSKLNAIAPTVYLSVDPTNYMKSLQENVTFIGKLLHKEVEAERELSKINDAITTLQKKTETTKTTGLILLANDGRFSAYGQASRFGIIHNTFGVLPIDEGIETSTHGQSVSYEYIVSKNPDYLFVIDRGRVTGTKANGHMFDNDLMRQTNAYKEKKIIMLDPEIWYLSSGGLQSTDNMIAEITQALAS